MLISLSSCATLRSKFLEVKRSKNQGATRPLWKADDTIPNRKIFTYWSNASPKSTVLCKKVEQATLDANGQGQTSTDLLTHLPDLNCPTTIGRKAAPVNDVKVNEAGHWNPAAWVNLPLASTGRHHGVQMGGVRDFRFGPLLPWQAALIELANQKGQQVVVTVAELKSTGSLKSLPAQVVAVHNWEALLRLGLQEFQQAANDLTCGAAPQPREDAA